MQDLGKYSGFALEQITLGPDDPAATFLIPWHFFWSQIKQDDDFVERQSYVHCLLTQLLLAAVSFYPY